MDDQHGIYTGYRMIPTKHSVIGHDFKQLATEEIKEQVGAKIFKKMEVGTRYMVRLSEEWRPETMLSFNDATVYFLKAHLDVVQEEPFFIYKDGWVNYYLLSTPDLIRHFFVELWKRIKKRFKGE